MDIILNQEYEIDNLITRVGRFNVMDFQQALMRFG